MSCLKTVRFRTQPLSSSYKDLPVEVLQEAQFLSWTTGRRVLVRRLRDRYVVSAGESHSSIATAVAYVEISPEHRHLVPAVHM